MPSLHLHYFLAVYVLFDVNLRPKPQEEYFRHMRLRWDVSHPAEVNKNINLGYSQDQGFTPSFRVRAFFRAILLCLILKRVLVAH